MNIFLSSRFIEFEEFRKQIIIKIENELPPELNVKIIALNPNESKLESAKVESEKGVKKSNLLILLIGDTYGNIDQVTNLSITHLEYKKAKELGIKIMAIYVGKYTKKTNFISDNDCENLKNFKKEIFPTNNAEFVYSSYNTENDETSESISNRIVSNLYKILSQIIDSKVSNNSSQKKTSVINFLEFTHYYELEFPLTLAKKIIGKDWEELKTTIGNKKNSLGFYVNGEYPDLKLVLNEEGLKKIEATNYNFQDNIVIDILTNCDMNNRNEEKLFTKLTLKEKYVQTIFHNFSHNIEYIIFNDKHLSNTKLALYYRLLAYYYADEKKYELMRLSFKKSIYHNNKTKYKSSPSFYYHWAIIEEKFGKFDQAKKIYDTIINSYQNTFTARLKLSIYYYKNKNKNDALSLFSIRNFELLKQPNFIIRFPKYISFLIKIGQSQQATILQDVLNDLVKLLLNKKETDLANYLIKKITKEISNNHKLKINLIKTYIKTDLSKAITEIKKLEKTNIYKHLQTGLYIDYYLQKKQIQTAITVAEQYIENENENLGYIYYKLAIIYSKSKKWDISKTYFEKISFEKIKDNFFYAISLMKTGNVGEKTLNIFNEYFRNNKGTQNTKAISKFIEYCLTTDNKNLARIYINNKFLNSKKYNYTRSFFSFLYQQQLFLTDNYEFSEIFLNSALDFARDDNQRAIIYSNYAKHLSYNEMDDTNAIEYFNKSYDIKPDTLVLFDIAKCYYRLEEYHLCINKLNEIKTENKQLINNISLLLIKVYNQRQDYIKLEHLMNNSELDNKSKAFLHLYLAERLTSDKKIRITHYKESIKFSNNYYSKLKYAIFLYSIDKRKGLKKFKEIDESLANNSKKKQVYNEFNYSIGFNPISQKTLNSIENSLSNITKWDQKVLGGINKLIIEHPFNDKLYGYLFEYYYRLKNFSGCFNVLDILIMNNQINYRTSNMFFEISENQFRYANFITFDKKGKRTIYKKNQVLALIKAKKYIEFAIKADSTNIEYLKLYSKILFKQGNLKKYKTVICFIMKKYKQKSLEIEYSDKKLKQQETIFLWPEINSDYNTKVKFYKVQEKIASAIIGNRDKNLPMAISILKSIWSDTEFNKENNFYLLRNITTRLGHIYFDIKKNYTKAFSYQEKVYKYNMGNLPFIGSFLKTISILKKFEFGIKICEEYLSIKKNPLILRHYGNFLKEKNLFDKSYSAYNDAIKLENDEKHKGILYNNILLLCKTSLENRDDFKNNSEILEISIEAHNKLIELYPSFEYIEESTTALNYIKKYVKR